MGERNNTGISLPNLPTPPRRLQSLPPELPPKHNVYIERELNIRLGIVPQPSSTVMSPSPLPSPPPLPGTHEQNDGDSDLYVNAVKPDLYVNAHADIVNNNVLDASVVLPENTENEALQMRCKVNQFPASAESSGVRGKGSRVSERVSQFVSAVENAANAKPEKPVLAQKHVHKLNVSSALAEKIASGLRHQETMRTVHEVEEVPDVGTDRTNGETFKQPSLPDTKKCSRSHNTEDIKCMLYNVQ